MLNKEIFILRNMIARNELAAADYYLSIDAHVAAIRRAKYVMKIFQILAKTIEH